MRVVLLVLALLMPWCSQAKQDGPDMNVLFVGNSLTYYNDLPGLVAQLAATDSGPSKISVEMLASGGLKIQDHLEAGHLERLLDERQFDVVVFQELGGWPLCPADFPGCSESIPSIQRLVELAREHGAMPVWFSTYQGFPEMQRALSQKAARIAAELDLVLVDAGAAWTSFESETEPGQPFLPDGHPNLLGSLIAALSIVRALPDVDPAVLAEPPEQICYRKWQGSGLVADRLASEQPPPSRTCEAIESTSWSAALVASRPG